MAERLRSTSLAAAVAVAEPLNAAATAGSVTYIASPLTLAAPMYLALLLPAARLSGRLGRC